MNTVNHETYVSLEVAKLLEKAGFDWECKCVYNKGKLCAWYEPKSNDWWKCQSDTCAAPTLAIAQKWLREVKDKQVHVISYRDQKTGKLQGWCYKVYEMSQGWEFNYPTYEKALEAGIKKCLEEDSITDKCSEE